MTTTPTPCAAAILDMLGGRTPFCVTTGIRYMSLREAGIIMELPNTARKRGQRIRIDRASDGRYILETSKRIGTLGVRILAFEQCTEAADVRRCFMEMTGLPLPEMETRLCQAS